MDGGTTSFAIITSLRFISSLSVVLGKTGLNAQKELSSLNVSIKFSVNCPIKPAWQQLVFPPFLISLNFISVLVHNITADILA